MMHTYWNTAEMLGYNSRIVLVHNECANHPTVIQMSQFVNITSYIVDTSDLLVGKL